MNRMRALTWVCSYLVLCWYRMCPCSCWRWGGSQQFSVQEADLYLYCVLVPSCIEIVEWVGLQGKNTTIKSRRERERESELLEPYLHLDRIRFHTTLTSIPPSHSPFSQRLWSEGSEKRQYYHECFLRGLPVSCFWFNVNDDLRSVRCLLLAFLTRRYILIIILINNSSYHHSSS